MGKVGVYMIKYKDECKRKVRKHESEEKINLK
jgi:hypothetical protein